MVIPDTTAPVITLTGPAEITLSVGDTYTEQGAVAEDNVDGTFAATVTGTVDTSVAETYTITYTATDEAGNAAEPVVRTVIVNAVVVPDTTAPVITLTGPSEITLSVGDTYTEQGAVAEDNVDGTFAATVTGTVDTSVAETYTITYTATDEAGNAAEPVVRTVIVNEVVVPDTTAPVITLTGPSEITLSVGDTYTEQGAVAEDNVDGTFAATVTGTVDTSVAETYTITYTATDEAGNAAEPVVRTVIVNEVVVPDTTAPVITLTGPSEITLSVGDTYTEQGAVAEDNVDGTFAATVTGTVDTSVAETYTITYTATDEAGNAAEPVVRTVIVSAVIEPPANRVTLNPTDDANDRVDLGDILPVSKWEHAYFRFDVSDVAGVVNNATFRVYNLADRGSITLYIGGIEDDNWSEQDSGPSWNIYP